MSGASPPRAWTLCSRAASWSAMAPGLRFVHEIARQAVLSEVAPHHARRAAPSRSSPPCSPIGVAYDARLAFHADAAGDVARVLEHAPRAARAAAAVSSHREAAAQFERAVRHAGSGRSSMTRAELHDELVRRAGAGRTLGRRRPAPGRPAVAFWHEAGDQFAREPPRARLGIVMWRLCRGPRVELPPWRRARQLLEPLGPTAELGNLYASGADALEPGRRQREHHARRRDRRVTWTSRTCACVR